MNGEYIQNLRLKLERRVVRLNSIDNSVRLHFALKQFWAFLHDNPILTEILHDLEVRYPEIGGHMHTMISDHNPRLFNREEEQAAAAYILFGICNGSGEQGLEAEIGKYYSWGSTHMTEKLSAFKSAFLEPLFDYLDEHIDDQRVVLALLRRYKHKCEWFHRNRLYKLWADNTTNGEKLLAMDMYDFLHDQGLDFTIEPSSVSGEADLVAAQNTDDPLVADVKIFCPPSKNKNYLIRGFNQVYTYTVDYNEPFGYMIIFKTCPEDIKFSLSNQTQSTPFIVHNNKTIFLITIDIYPHEESASRRRQLQSYEIAETDLIHLIETSRNQSTENNE